MIIKFKGWFEGIQPSCQGVKRCQNNNEWVCSEYVYSDFKITSYLVILHESKDFECWYIQM